MVAVAEVHTRIAARFVELGIGVAPEFGEAALSTRTDLNRKVVLAPGDASRSLGKLLPPQGPGGEPTKRIASLDELFRVYVAAYDPDRKEDPKAQYVATRELFDVTYAALFASYRAFLPVSCNWVVGSIAAPFGAALMLVASVRCSILDWSEGEAVLVKPKSYALTAILKAPSGQESEE